MSITIDDTTLEVGTHSFLTVGHVLSHVARENKLVVQLLIDGAEPDLGGMDSLRLRPIADSAIYIETANPQAICRHVLDALDETLVETDGLRIQAAERFRKNDPAGALPKLAACFTLWHNAQDALGKTARLLRLDLESVAMSAETCEHASIKEMLGVFSTHLRNLKEGLEAHDFVLCCDVLTYELETASTDWKAAVAALRSRTA